MPKKPFSSHARFQLSPNRFNSNRRSKSVDPQKSTSSYRRSPIRPISFQIRERRDHAADSQNHQQQDDQLQSQSHAQLQAQNKQQQQQNQLDESAFDPWGSTSFTSLTLDTTPGFPSPTTVMDPPSFQNMNDLDTPPTNNKQSHLHSKSSTKSLSPNFYRSGRKNYNSTCSASPTNTNSPANRSNGSTHGSTDNTTNLSAYDIRNPSTSNRLIPGVSQMTMRQTLAIIFSAFWERADLYTDVLALDHDKPSARQLRLAFFRQGRTVLATPIESPDDMTILDAGMKPIFAIGGGSVTDNDQPRKIVQSGVKVSRKAKIKFQAINLAYDLLNDPEKRKTYNEWRLWHCRLPDPKEVSYSQQRKQQQQRHERQLEDLYEEQNSRNQRVTMMKEGKPFFRNVHSFDSTSTTVTGTDESSAMESSINSKSSLPSILREPTFGKKKKKKNQRSKALIKNEINDRRIRWNEEVEELVILECSRDQSSSDNLDLPTSQDSHSKDYEKENEDPFGCSFADPYENHTIEDDWFGQSSTSGSRRNGTNSSTRSTATIQQKDPQSFNFQSLQDSRLTFLETQPSSSSSSLQGGDTNNKDSLDDSLIAILDAPNPSPNLIPSPQVQNQRRPPTSLNSWTNKVGAEMRGRHLSRQRRSPSPVSRAVSRVEKENTKPGHHVVADETYHIGNGNKNNVKVNVKSFQKDKLLPPIYQGPTSTKTTTVTTTKVQSATNVTTESKDLFDKYKEAQHEIDVDDFSIDTRSTKDTYDSYNWRSQGQSTDCSFAHQNDCAVFGQSRNCSPIEKSNDCMGATNDCGSIDLAKGFQASLSNYINAAVSDMKEGLMSLGKKWEDNVPKMSENGENPFQINSFELDAMMDILKVEMSTISPVVNGNCTG